MICIKCGKEIPNDSQFCSFCASPVNGQGVQQPVQSTVSTQSSQQVSVQPAVPVQPAAPVQQPAPVQQNNYQNVGPAVSQPVNGGSFGFSSGQKIIIVVLLVVIVFGLGFLALRGKVGSLMKDDTRTIMIYLDGSNLESDSGIATADLLAIDAEKIDLTKVNILVYTGGTKEWQNDFVSNDENAIFLFTADGYQKLETYDQLSMGDPDTLSSFLNYCYKNYKAGHYNLILDDHGGAIDGAIYDDFTNDNLTLADFEKALSDSPFNSKNKMDAVIFRTCLNGTLEVASIFVPYSDYIVFSEEVSVGGGSSNVLSFINNVTAEDDGYNFGKKFIDRYQEQVDEIDLFGVVEVTYSIVDLSKVENVINELDTFIAGVDIKEHYNKISKIRGNLYQYGSADTNIYDTVDLYTLIDKLEDFSSVSADKVKKAINDAVVYNHTNLDDSTGMSIYFPYNGKGKIVKFLSVYKNLDFSDNYRKFINSFYGVQSTADKFSYTFTENETVVDDSKEVSLLLTEDELNTYSHSLYSVFKRDPEHPNYYFLIYNSDGATLTDDGMLKTNIGDNLIKDLDSDGEFFIPLMHRVIGGKDTYYVVAIMYNPSLDYTYNNYSFITYNYFSFERDTGKPFIATAKVNISDDDRTVGTLVDLKKYTDMYINCSEYKLLDENGNVMDEWEASPTYTILAGGIDTFNFQKAKIEDDGEYYVVFRIFDVNNDSHLSKLIKVG